jgi:hypothetical protein
MNVGLSHAHALSHRQLELQLCLVFVEDDLDLPGCISLDGRDFT